MSSDQWGFARGAWAALWRAELGLGVPGGDAAKETANLEKHGVDVSTVPAAFDDPRRLVVEDAARSASEPRFYCIGHDGRGILTVRFTLREGNIRVIGAGYWRTQKDLHEKENH